ncbi:DUF2972 domain-containing protein, partial [Campylobacter upsaliensis]|uniref:DUF2972 domain-containing protein n=3 Tax=Campylobacter upsaliensis TaxID=28080 RepID=UPI002B3EEF62
QCFDFNEALWVKTHLSYRLGKILLSKASYFNLYGKIKQAKKEFKALKESRVYRLKDKLKFKNEEDFDLFIKNYALIENLLTHYEALNEVIVLNKAFVLEHFDEVSLWLNSKEFKEKYEDINHPYPPILNPNILNELLLIECDDKQNLKRNLKQQALKLSKEALAYINANLDYRLIPAEMAWEMNLPLPRRYEFIHLSTFGSAYAAMQSMYSWCGVNVLCLWNPNDAKDTYLHHYARLMCSKEKPCCIYLDGFNLQVLHQIKFFKLIDAPVSMVAVVRDPLARLKPLINHLSGCRPIMRFNLTFSQDEVLDSVRYYDSTSGEAKRPVVENIKSGASGYGKNNAIKFSLASRIYYLNKKVHYIDMNDISGEKTFDTLKQLAKELHFDPPKEELKETKLKGKINGGDFLGLVPRTLVVHSKDVDRKCKDESSLKRSDVVELVITTESHTSLDKIVDLSRELLGELTMESLIIYTTNLKAYENLKKDTKTLQATQIWLQNYVKRLKEVIREENAKRINEEQILNYLKKDKEVREFYRKNWKKELTHIKANRPDIVASWKYYKEFEKMCEEFKE